VYRSGSHAGTCAHSLPCAATMWRRRWRDSSVTVVLLYLPTFWLLHKSWKGAATALENESAHSHPMQSASKHYFPTLHNEHRVKQCPILIVESVFKHNSIAFCFLQVAYLLTCGLLSMPVTMTLHQPSLVEVLLRCNTRCNIRCNTINSWSSEAWTTISAIKFLPRSRESLNRCTFESLADILLWTLNRNRDLAARWPRLSRWWS